MGQGLDVDAYGITSVWIGEYRDTDVYPAVGSLLEQMAVVPDRLHAYIPVGQRPVGTAPVPVA